MQANTASLSNCKRLYELSGWDNTYMSWDVSDRADLPFENVVRADETTFTTYPAYSLGFLIRKLADWNGALRMSFDFAGGRKWHFDLNDIENLPYTSADTPEDCAALLCIKLFDLNILKREGAK